LATLTLASDFNDIDKDIAQICVENGFNFETHAVTTEDGYILEQFRIPGSGPPVFF
jgi:pimeloyl-ACP methyl ester carboxylesterase